MSCTPNLGRGAAPNVNNAPRTPTLTLRRTTSLRVPATTDRAAVRHGLGCTGPRTRPVPACSVDTKVLPSVSMSASGACSACGLMDVCHESSRLATSSLGYRHCCYHHLPQNGSIYSIASATFQALHHHQQSCSLLLGQVQDLRVLDPMLLSLLCLRQTRFMTGDDNTCTGKACRAAPLCSGWHMCTA